MYKSCSLNFSIPESRQMVTRNSVALNTIKYIKYIKITRVSQDWCTVDFVPHKVKIGLLSAIEPCTPRAQSCPDDYNHVMGCTVNTPFPIATRHTLR